MPIVFPPYSHIICPLQYNRCSLLLCWNRIWKLRKNERQVTRLISICERGCWRHSICDIKSVGPEVCTLGINNTTCKHKTNLGINIIFWPSPPNSRSKLHSKMTTRTLFYFLQQNLHPTSFKWKELGAPKWMKCEPKEAELKHYGHKASNKTRSIDDWL